MSNLMRSRYHRLDREGGREGGRERERERGKSDDII